MMAGHTRLSNTFLGKEVWIGIMLKVKTSAYDNMLCLVPYCKRGETGSIKGAKIAQTTFDKHIFDKHIFLVDPLEALRSSVCEVVVRRFCIHQTLICKATFVVIRFP